MKKRTIVLATVLSLIVGLLTGCGSGQKDPAPANSTAATENSTPAKAADPVTWKFDSTYSTAIYEDADGVGTADPEKYFMEKIAEVTEGRYQVKTFLDNTLAKNMTERVNGLKSGAFELASPALGSWGEYTDAFAELNVPFLFKNLDVVEKFLESDVAEAMKAKAEADVGVKCLWWGIVGYREISTSGKPVHTADDVKGIKIRVQSDPIQVASFEALGANVTSTPFSELFTAMQQHLIDAQENPLNNVYNNKFYEVQDYITMTNHSFTASMYIMSMDVWNSLSAEDQAAIEALCDEMPKIGLDAIRSSEEMFVDLLEQNGVEVYYPTNEELDSFKQAMYQDVYPKCEEVMGTERWNALMDCIADIESELGLS